MRKKFQRCSACAMYATHWHVGEGRVLRTCNKHESEMQGYGFGGSAHEREVFIALSRNFGTMVPVER